MIIRPLKITIASVVRTEKTRITFSDLDETGQKVIAGFFPLIGLSKDSTDKKKMTK